MYGFKNAVIPNSKALGQEELKLFLATMRMMLKSGFAGEPETGTIVLYDQKRENKAKCAFVLNWEKGEKMMLNRDGNTISSMHLAIGATKDLLQWPKCERYRYDANPLEFGQLKSGIYYGDNDEFALVANTTLGRFVMSSYIDFNASTMEDFKKMNSAVLLAMAGILRRLRTDDVVLRNTMDSLLKECDCQGISSEFFTMVRDVFTPKKGLHLAEFDTWEAWRIKEQEQGRVKMYFRGYT